MDSKKIILSLLVLAGAFYFSERFIVPELFTLDVAPELQTRLDSTRLTAQTVPTTADIWLEAEYPSAIISPFVQANNSLASNSQYIWTPQNAGNDIGSATYNINIANSGTYIVWGRVFTTSGGSDSFYISMDGGVETIWYTGTSTLWRWDKSPGTYVLSAGTHTLKIRNREDGTQLDKILLTSNTALTPSGLGGAAINIPGTPTPTPLPISGDFAPLCYLNPSTSTTVTSCSALNTALNSATAGKRIIVANGTYNGCTITSSNSGNSGNPIIIEGASRSGVLFTNSTITVNGNYNVVANITFDTATIQVFGSNNRVTRNIFQNRAVSYANDGAVLVQTGSFNRIDHNEFKNFIVDKGVKVIPTTASNTQKNVVDRNYFHDFPGPYVNGNEVIQLGSNSTHSGMSPRAIVEYNLIDRAEHDSEMLSPKSSDNTVRFNTFSNSKAVIGVRHGSRNKFISNTLINMLGLTIQGDDNEVIGNDLQDTPLIARDGDTTEDAILAGGSGHPAAKNTLVAANKLTGTLTQSYGTPSYIGVGMRTPNGDNSSGVPAQNTTLAGNAATIQYGSHTGTQVLPTYSGTVYPTVRLFPADVGPLSADTACSAVTPLAGDLNSDRIINSIDFSIMNGKWLTSDATSDLNKDGIVNSLDFSILNGNWLKTY